MAAAMPMITNSPYRTIPLLIAITIRVGSGSCAPMPLNIAAKVGMTFHRITVTTTAAMTMIATGYTIADFTCPLSFTAFSMNVASRLRIVSRMPPASPAAIMLVNSGSKVFGCFRIASASEAPDSTSVRVCRMTAAKFLSSSCEPRMSRHCTSGRPASIITENWRTNTARFLGDTVLSSRPAFLAAATAFTLAGVIRVTRI